MSRILNLLNEVFLLLDLLNEDFFSFNFLFLLIFLMKM